MSTKIVIAMGYDNELTRKDIDAIKNIKKYDRHKKYEWNLSYYIPNIPAICLVEKSCRLIEQNYRDKARAMLEHISQQLDIPLPMKGNLTAYNQVIELGSTAIIYASRNLKDVSTILINNPDKIKFDIFDRVLNYVKATHLWQYVNSKLTYARSRSLTLISPEQFAEQYQGRRFTCQEENIKQIAQKMGVSFSLCK